MKKSIFLIAAMAGALFTACTSEENLTLDNPGKQASANVAVGFDTYLSQNTQTQTRAGQQNVMTNAKQQKAQANEGGFGVFAVQHNATYVVSSTHKEAVETPASSGYWVGDWTTAQGNGSVEPDFMWNQGVFYSASAWGYTPLKYWPNETWNDSQETPAYSQTNTGTTRDKVSFFAYAPYVNFTAGSGSTYPASGTQYSAVSNYSPADGSAAVNTGAETPAKTGIMAVTGNTFATDAPKVYYKVNHNATVATQKPENSVDLLWGVAPAGGLNYTAVNKNAVSIAEGMPLYNLEKPSENEKIKFSFQHALSRLSLTIVAALDQMGAGGEFEAGPTTKINVEEVKIKATNFNTEGWLDLNNQFKNRAKWEYTGSDPYYANASESSWLFFMSNASKKGEAGSASVTGNALLNTSIWDMGTDIDGQTEGVMTSEKDLMAPIVDPDKVDNDGAASTPTFKFGTSKWKNDANNNAVEATAYYANSTYYTKVNEDKYILKNQIELKGSVPQASYFTTTGLTSTAFNANGSDNLATLGGSASTPYWHETTVGSDKVYTKVTFANTSEVPAAGNYYSAPAWADANAATVKTDLEATAYTSAVYYSGTLPRYWMVIPAYYSGSDTQSTNVTVQITYYVTTHDENLAFGGDADKKYSRVQNVIEKTVPVKFESGKSYNLKLILGLTSVKLAAEVADWKLAGDTEVNLPQNVE